MKHTALYWMKDFQERYLLREVGPSIEGTKEPIERVSWKNTKNGRFIAFVQTPHRSIPMIDATYAQFDKTFVHATQRVYDAFSNLHKMSLGSVGFYAIGKHETRARGFGQKGVLTPTKGHALEQAASDILEALTLPKKGGRWPVPAQHASLHEKMQFLQKFPTMPQFPEIPCVLFKTQNVWILEGLNWKGNILSLRHTD